MRFEARRPSYVPAARFGLVLTRYGLAYSYQGSALASGRPVAPRARADCAVARGTRRSTRRGCAWIKARMRSSRSTHSRRASDRPMARRLAPALWLLVSAASAPRPGLANCTPAYRDEGDAQCDGGASQRSAGGHRLESRRASSCRNCSRSSAHRSTPICVTSSRTPILILSGLFGWSMKQPR